MIMEIKKNALFYSHRRYLKAGLYLSADWLKTLHSFSKQINKNAFSACEELPYNRIVGNHFILVHFQQSLFEFFCELG